MFPVTKDYQVYYRTEGNKFATLVQQIVDKNTSRIVSDCQRYLDRYAAGERPQFSTDIDFLLSVLAQKATDADDAYCEQLYQDYLKDPDRGQLYTEDEVRKDLNIML